jgi:hypothetical protein
MKGPPVNREITHCDYCQEEITDEWRYSVRWHLPIERRGDPIRYCSVGCRHTLWQRQKRLDEKRPTRDNTKKVAAGKAARKAVKARAKKAL